MKQSKNIVLKFIYSIFIGVLFATLVGVGIAAFYPEPKPPEYPSALKIPREGGLNQPVFEQLKGEQEEYVLLLSDIHVGSTLFLEEEFTRFIQWINGKAGNQTQLSINLTPLAIFFKNYFCRH